MIQNYIKVAIRNILKNRIYTFINIIGLSVGLTCFLLLTLHVKDEFSYDDFHVNADNIYQVVLERKYPDHVTNYAFVPHSYSDVIVKDFAEVKNAVRVLGGGNNTVRVEYITESEEKIAFDETRLILADSSFFDIFSFELIKGDKRTVLSKAQSVVVTESTAKKYFGDSDPLNKTLNTDFGEFKVTGVCKDIPANSHLEFDFVGSMRSSPFIVNTLNYTGFSVYMYLELDNQTSKESLEAKFPKMVETYAAPQIETNLNTTFREYVAAGNGYNYYLIPVKDIHLYPVEYQGTLKPGGNINDIYILILIALLILLIACINFMNLATARSTERGKEVGIRKTMGSHKLQLVFQFLTEAIVTAMIAGLISVLFIQLLLPTFNTFIGKSLEFPFTDIPLLLSIGGLALGIGILSGSYPAFVLSSFNPVYVLKGTLSSGKNSTTLRNVLVVGQFAISIVLIIGTLVVKDQIDFLNSKNLGYDKDNVIAIERAGVLAEQQQAFIDELKNIPGIKSTAASGSLPINQYFGIQFQVPGQSEVFTTNGMIIDDEYADMIGFKIVQGRGFSKDYSDSLSILINEQTVALLGAENPIGMTFKNTNGNPPVTRDLTIIGVVQDFNYMSLREKITPFVLLNTEMKIFGPNNPFVNVRIDSDDSQATLQSIESTWKKFVPQEPFNYKFLDQEIKTLYKNESNTGSVFAVFSALAIIIACVGLFGLAAYMTSLRTKEIGIRKVMGASVGTVVVLLSKDFTKLILIASIIAIPSGWYVMDKWLGSFAFRTDINWWVFLLAGILALSIAIITVSYQSIRAAIMNPTRSLRSE